MPKPGTRRSPARFTASWAMLLIAASPAGRAMLLMAASPTGIDQPLEGRIGDPTRGATVVMRQSSTCVLCHAGPFPNPHLQGDVGPDLHGVGARLSVPELRQQLVDASRANPGTVMPSFYRTEGLARVGPAWRGKPILSAGEIEDAVAFLATLQSPSRGAPTP